MSTQIRVIREMWVRTPRLMCLFTQKIWAFLSSSKTSLLNKQTALINFKLLAVLMVTLFFASCQKEQLSNPMLNSTDGDDFSADARSNNPPSVDAGPIRRVVYSSAVSSRSSASNSAMLYGRASDVEGAVTVQWAQTDGPVSAVIAQPTNDTTAVDGLVPGVYTFVLTATDIRGVSRKDSTSVTVLQKMTWTVEGITREALVHLPNSNVGAAPVLFAFHGHGGSDLGFAERAFELNWPEAIVVYPQGLPTKSGGDKEGRQTGWQHEVGEVNAKTGVKDQDLKFFDAMLSELKNVDNANSNQVFVHGWSNGGEFVYDVLWTARANNLTALAPAAATVGTTSDKKQLPVMQVAGTQDSKVRFSNQQKSVQSVRTLNVCPSAGTTWATGPGKLMGTEYASDINKQVVMLQYDGGHSYPFTVPAYIVQFFKEVAGVK